MENFEKLLRESSRGHNDSPKVSRQGSSEDQNTAEILHGGVRIPVADLLTKGPAASGASLESLLSDPNLHGNRSSTPVDTDARGTSSSDTREPPPDSHATPQGMHQVIFINIIS